MSLTFWIKRFLVVFTFAFVFLLAVGLLKQRPWHQAAGESALWAAVSTSIFISVAVSRARKKQYCALCGETPDTPPGGAGAGKERGRES